MWPWSLISGLRHDLQNLREGYGEILVNLRSTEAILRERDNQLERLRQDYDRLHSDFNAVVAHIGNLASRPVGRTLFDIDPFQEDNKQPDTWLSPAEGEADVETLTKVMETPVGEGTE